MDKARADDEDESGICSGLKTMDVDVALSCS